MKLSTIVKIAVTSSVVLLCTGFALYSFFRLSSAENNKDFNLYSLVPTSAMAVFETNDAVELVAEVDGLTCSKNQQFVHVSKLFSSLKQYLYTVLENAPHGLSRQMNKVLISFHKPDNDRNQVLYCSLGPGDQALIEAFVQKYASPDFSPRIFKYKNEEITIYPLADGDFLACYLASDFLALSFQKKLIEDVIDARKSGKSLTIDPVFTRGKKGSSMARLYARLEGVIGWTEFDLKLKGDFIYLSGVSHNVDTCSTFINVLCKQDSVEGFSGEILPSSTFYFSKHGIDQWPVLLTYIESKPYTKNECLGDVNEWDKELAHYLNENTGSDLVTCLFQREDSLLGPAAVMSVYVKDGAEAEKQLRSLIGAIPVEGGEKRKSDITFCYTSNKAYVIYVLPSTTLFTQLTNLIKPTLHIYVAFYKGRLLMALDSDSLSRYIRQLEMGEIMDTASSYRADTDGLSDSYNYMLMADFEQIFRQPQKNIQTIPDFFFRNADFFRYFVLYAQFTCADGMVYPNVVLRYKVDNLGK